jgi:hypothetical protein
MKTLIYCPKCRKPLKSEHIYLGPDTYYWNKDCVDITHRFYSRTLIGNDDELVYVLLTLSVKKFLMAGWELRDKRAFIRTPSKDYPIPFFIPNFSNYDKLINKLKTYALFS